MKKSSKASFAHVLWVGGATDAGKTTVAQLLGKRYNWQTYHYDHHSHGYLEKKAETEQLYREFLAATNNDRWVQPDVRELLQFALHSFRSSFPLVLDDLRQFSTQQIVVAEGFGLLPELVFPLLADKVQAVWLVPTPNFKWASMTRRNKPSFKNDTSDPEKATQNLYERDMLIAEEVAKQASERALNLYEIDGLKSAEDMTDVIAQQFQQYLHSLTS